MEATAYEGAGFAQDLAIILGAFLLAGAIIWLLSKYSRKP